jgi:hypothetical protein
MKHLIILFSFFSFSLKIVAQNTNTTYLQNIKGVVIDEQSGNTIMGASVTIEQLNNATTITNATGQFYLKNIPIGRHTIKVTNVGYDVAYVSNVEVTSSKEVVLEIKIKEKIIKGEIVTVKSGKSKIKPINETAVISARQLSIDEAFRYSGTRSDPSRMAQNFAGVSGGNDARNDIIIRGNSPSGVLWRMDAIDIPNPNHFSTLGSTGGPVSILNINTLRNSDFITSAFPAQYGNAIAGVFDLRMRTGNADKHEFIGQMGFNGIEFGAEGPLSKKNKSSYLINYRYSMVAGLQKIGLNVGTGSATPYYQDVTFKFNLPTKKTGTFSLFGLGGESHINFSPESQTDDNLYASSDGSIRDRKFKSLTGVIGLSNNYFFNKNTSSKTVVAVSGFSSRYNEFIVANNKPNQLAFLRNNDQTKISLGNTFNKKFNAKNQLTAGVLIDVNKLKLQQDLIKNGDSVLFTLINTNENAMLTKAFTNYSYRMTDKLSTNLGLFFQYLNINNTKSIEPRWNLKYQVKPNQTLALGAGLHSQLQPLETYFYQSKTPTGQTEFTNKNLGFVKSMHTVMAYDITVTKFLRIKTELYNQQIFDAAVEKNSTSFSMINAGADFGFPDKTNLINNGKGYNRGIELTAEHFLHKGFYYLFTASVFESKYKGSDNIWRNTAFNSNYVINALTGKEFAINNKTTFGIDTKLTYTGGNRYTPFDKIASNINGYIIFKENEAYSLQNNAYFRWDVKLSYNRNLKKVTQKWYIDLQNVSNQKNIYIRNLVPQTGKVSEINQIGFFPNINYQITF